MADVKALKEVAEQAVVLYEGMRAKAEDEDDIQAENFWEGHRNAVMRALGTYEHGSKIVDALLGPLPSGRADVGDVVEVLIGARKGAIGIVESRIPTDAPYERVGVLLRDETSARPYQPNELRVIGHAADSSRDAGGPDGE